MSALDAFVAGPLEVARLSAIVQTPAAVRKRVQLPGVDEARLASGDVILHEKSTRDEEFQLARSAMAGDEQAWQEILRRHASSVKRMLAAKGLTNELDDLLQEIFMKVFAGLGSYMGLASLNTWVLRIAQYHVTNHVRNQRSRRTHEVLESDLATDEPFSLEDSAPGMGPSPLDVYRERERQRLAVRIFLEVDTPYRVAIVLTQLCGCSYEDAAYVLGIAEGTVKSRISRGRAIIAKKMKAAGFE